MRWIIRPEERAAFLRLGNNQDRERFIEEFWKRRDPTPDTVENEFKEEHYRRIAYANMHFGWQKVQGWETDRGRIYILYGPPNSIKVSRWSSTALRQRKQKSALPVGSKWSRTESQVC